MSHVTFDDFYKVPKLKFDLFRLRVDLDQI